MKLTARRQILLTGADGIPRSLTDANMVNKKSIGTCPHAKPPRKPGPKSACKTVKQRAL